MEYQNLNKEDFDAVVLGEVTHYALWLEDELNNIISDYFIIIICLHVYWQKVPITEMRGLPCFRWNWSFSEKEPCWACSKNRERGEWA
jgi:hypothetical protein